MGIGFYMGQIPWDFISQCDSVRHDMYAICHLTWELILYFVHLNKMIYQTSSVAVPQKHVEQGYTET